MKVYRSSYQQVDAADQQGQRACFAEAAANFADEHRFKLLVESRSPCLVFLGLLAPGQRCCLGSSVVDFAISGDIRHFGIDGSRDRPGGH